MNAIRRTMEFILAADWVSPTSICGFAEERAGDWLCPPVPPLCGGPCFLAGGR